MIDKIRYKEFIGSVHFSAEDEVFFGKIEGVNDLVTFEGDTVKQLKKAFEEAVDDYIELCQEIGKTVFKSFKGSFNVRINPQLHSQAFERALEEGKSLNQFVQDAIETKLQSVNK
jgi:predicted HicB family RNase H-like nuclease